MSTAFNEGDRIAMSQRERDRSRVLHSVLEGQRTQVEAARLLRLTPRHVRRLVRRLQQGGDAGLVHGLRGQPSNRRKNAKLRRRVVQVYRKDYHDFGPTFAAEKLAERGLVVSPDTLRRWLLAEDLWQPKRRRDPHRSRRPRRACFGELVQMDTSIHDWTEGRGEEMVLLHMIDDATSRLLARFYDADTVLNHMDLLLRWLRVHGRPLALYTDRHSIFEAQHKGRSLADAETQFGRALRELAVELIRAHSPQAKGRVERSFGTAQDRLVKEMRLAKVKTIVGANALLDGGLLAKHNRLFSVAPRETRDAHRELGTAFNTAAILSLQEQRTAANDYTVRFENRTYQIDKPSYPGLRQGRVVIEVRLDGTMAIRFGDKYLKYHEIAARVEVLGGSAPQTPRSLAHSRPTPEGKEQGRPSPEDRPPGVQPTDGRSGRTSAEPYPPGGAEETTKKGPYRPAADHPWRRGFRAKR
jgi:Helix-turn-helix domain